MLCQIFFREQLIELHDATVKLLVTKSTRGELKMLGESHSAAAVVAKRFEVLKYEPPPASPLAAPAAPGGGEQADSAESATCLASDGDDAKQNLPHSEFGPAVETETVVASPTAQALRARRRRQAKKQVSSCLAQRSVQLTVHSDVRRDPTGRTGERNRGEAARDRGSKQQRLTELRHNRPDATTPLPALRGAVHCGGPGSGRAGRAT